jgi:hypothetical protein
MQKVRHPIFHKSLYGILTALALAVLVYTRAGNERSEFYQTTGEVLYIGEATASLPQKDKHKHRYLQVSSHAKTFELFVGKATGDFQPQFEKLDSLQTGDTVTIYYDENPYTENDHINRLAYFIDRGKEPVFIKGSWEKKLAYFILGLCALLAALLFYLKKKGRIS